MRARQSRWTAFRITFAFRLLSGGRGAAVSHTESQAQGRQGQGGAGQRDRHLVQGPQYVLAQSPLAWSPLDSRAPLSRCIAITVSSQNIGQDKGEQTTSRNQSLKDLFGQIRHYHAATRKGTPNPLPELNVPSRSADHGRRLAPAAPDAVYGLRELLQRHPTSITQHLGQIFEATCPLLVDVVRLADAAALRVGRRRLRANHLRSLCLSQDAPVRHALSSFLQALLDHLTEVRVRVHGARSKRCAAPDGPR